MNQMTIRFLDFLKDDLAIPAESIALAVRDVYAMPHHFPMILWQYGLVNKEQLEDVFDWLEEHCL